MTSENYLSQAGIMPKHGAERYTEYAGPTHDQHVYFPYEPSPHIPHVHASLPSKHHYGGGGHKSNAGMTALTLLAFLFFLHILQQCLKEHMTSLNTPQIMVMTGGREGEESIAKVSRKKLDKAGVSETDRNDKRKTSNSGAANDAAHDNDEKYLMKITSSDYAPWKKFQNDQNVFNHDTRASDEY